MKHLGDNPKPFYIEPLATPCNKTANFIVWDSFVALLNKRGPYFNNGLGILNLVTMVSKTSSGLCLAAPVLCLVVRWWLDAQIE
jgi:hypothetical protein